MQRFALAFLAHPPKRDATMGPRGVALAGNPKENPARAGFSLVSGSQLEAGMTFAWRLTSHIHTAHAAHAAMTAAAVGMLFLRRFGNHRVGRQDQTRNRSRVLQRSARNLG